MKVNSITPIPVTPEQSQLKQKPEHGRALPGPREPQNLSYALRQLGLPLTPQMEAIAQAYVSWGVPLDPAAMLRILTATQGMTANELAARLKVWGWGQAVGLGDDEAQLRDVTRLLLGMAEGEEIPPSLQSLNNTAASLFYPEVKGLWWERGAHRGEMYVLRDRTAKQESAETLQVAVRVHTAHFGELWLSFSYCAGQIELVCRAGDGELLKRIADGRAAIAAAVEAAGATLSDLRCQEGLALSLFDVFPPAQVGPYMAVDLKV